MPIEDFPHSLGELYSSVYSSVFSRLRLHIPFSLNIVGSIYKNYGHKKEGGVYTKRKLHRKVQEIKVFLL